MATQTGLADVTVRLKGVAAEVQIMDDRMHKFEGNLTAMQQRTDDRMQQMDTQQRVIIVEAQVHSTVASVHDMKLQLQAEVALNITRTKKQQEDAHALAALVEQKLQAEAAWQRAMPGEFEAQGKVLL
jgi:hypothetical protein